MVSINFNPFYILFHSPSLYTVYGHNNNLILFYPVGAVNGCESDDDDSYSLSWVFDHDDADPLLFLLQWQIYLQKKKTAGSGPPDYTGKAIFSLITTIINSGCICLVRNEVMPYCLDNDRTALCSVLDAFVLRFSDSIVSRGDQYCIYLCERVFCSQIKSICEGWRFLVIQTLLRNVSLM